MTWVDEPHEAKVALLLFPESGSSNLLRRPVPGTASDPGTGGVVYEWTDATGRAVMCRNPMVRRNVHYVGDPRISYIGVWRPGSQWVVGGEELLRSIKEEVDGPERR